MSHITKAEALSLIAKEKYVYNKQCGPGLIKIKMFSNSFEIRGLYFTNHSNYHSSAIWTHRNNFSSNFCY